MTAADTIQRELKALAAPAQREALMRFFKTGKGQYGEGDRFLGVKVPQTRAVVRKYAAGCSLADIEELIVSPYHELRFAALLVLCRKFKLAKRHPEVQRAYVDTYLVHTDVVNNWDLVDLSYYELLLAHPHDLIHKAVGWLLREVGKRDRRRLEDFLTPRCTAMPRTMLRYAVEKFPEPLRQRYLRVR